jgi:hypothetical protein
MNYDQFTGEDTGLSRDLIQDSRRLVERRFVIKRVTAYSSQTTAQQASGKIPTSTTILIEMSGKEKMMSGRDVLSGAGLYAEGDLEMHTQDPVFGPDDRNTTEADRMIRDGVNYIQIGFPNPVSYAGGRVKWISHWRRKN